MLIPITVAMGLIGLVALWWTLRHGQYEDPVGDAERIVTLIGRDNAASLYGVQGRALP